jgi:hypothetical protein
MRRIEIDGVPTVISPVVSGPAHAGLVFRVGQADETLARRGITHLVEHLALHSIGVADHHYNGTTTAEFTWFHTQGSAAEITAFLTGVCASLRDLPMRRLATEKEILRTEQSGRGRGPMAIWRHGARDFGLPGYPEWGLPALGPDDLRAWVAHFFTRGNAALWIAADEVPAGLRLDLPDGPRRPAPAPSSALPRTPAYFRDGSGVLVWDSVVPRDAAAVVFSGVLERAMMRSLRQDSGLSYSVEVGYDGRTDGTALITAAADAHPEKRAAVLGGFIDVLAALRFGRVDEKDVSTVAAQRREGLTRAVESGLHLPGRVFDILAGRPEETTEGRLAELATVTPSDVARVAAAAWDNGLLMTPHGRDADWTGFVAAPVCSPTTVSGTAYPALGQSLLRLIAGQEGISVVDPDGDAATVRFAELSAMVAWPDGGRMLIGHDGVTVRVEPSLYRNAAVLIPWLDQTVPPMARVLQPPREPSAIPQPPSVQPGQVSVPRSATGPILALVLGIPFALVLLFLNIVFVVAIASGDEVVAMVIALIITLTASAGVVLLLRWAIRGLRTRRHVHGRG